MPMVWYIPPLSPGRRPVRPVTTLEDAGNPFEAQRTVDPDEYLCRSCSPPVMWVPVKNSLGAGGDYHA